MSFVLSPSPLQLLPSLLAHHPLFVLSRLVFIALFVAVTIAHSQQWWRQWQLGAGGGNLAAAKAVGRRWQWRSGSVSAAAALSLWQR